MNVGDICPMSATARASNIHRKKISPTEVAEWMPGTVPIVFVVDNDATVRESLQLLIQNAGCQAETFASAEEFLSRARVLTPSCLVLDVTLPNLNGLDLQKRIADRVDMPIIFFTGDHDVRTTVRAMKAGAAEFLTKPCDRDVLLSAIRHAVDRSNRVLREEAEMGSLRNHFASLTPREREVMDLVVAGELNKQIGAELGISELTVKAHRGKVMRKMKAGSLAGLVIMAERLYPAICAQCMGHHEPAVPARRSGGTSASQLIHRPIFSRPGNTMNTASAAHHESKASLKSCAAPTVFVVDGDVTVRESLELLIQSAGWQPESFACAQDFLSRRRVLAPSCLVLDVTLPDLNGLDLQKRVADRIEMPLIFITAYADVPTTVQAMKAGAVEFLARPFSDEVLLSSIRDAIERSHAALRREAQIQPLRTRYASLSRREREVMELVVSGQMNKQVGGELGISEITVLAHRGKVMRKMEADSLADLVRMAARLRGTPTPKT